MFLIRYLVFNFLSQLIYLKIKEALTWLFENKPDIPI